MTRRPSCQSCSSCASCSSCPYPQRSIRCIAVAAMKFTAPHLSNHVAFQRNRPECIKPSPHSTHPSSVKQEVIWATYTTFDHISSPQSPLKKCNGVLHFQVFLYFRRKKGYIAIICDSDIKDNKSFNFLFTYIFLFFTNLNTSQQNSFPEKYGIGNKNIYMMGVKKTAMPIVEEIPENGSKLITQKVKDIIESHPQRKPEKENQRL